MGTRKGKGTATTERRNPEQGFPAEVALAELCEMIAREGSLKGWRLA